MPRKAKGPSERARTWKTRLNKAKDFRKKHEPKWRRFIDYYESDYYDLPTGPSDNVTDYVAINLLKANIQTMLAALYYHNPVVYVKAKRPEFKEKVALCESVVNYWINELDTKTQMRRSVLDWMLIGHMWSKTGYYGTVTEEQVKTPSGTEPEYDLNIRDGFPFVQRVSPFKMLVDPAATTFEQARWMAEEVQIPYEESIRKWPVLKDAIGVGVYFEDEFDTGMPKKLGTDDDKKEGFLKFFKVFAKEWDKDSDDYQMKYILLCEGYDETLADEPVADGLEGFPYTYAPWDECTDTFYPQAMAEAIEDLLLSYNKLRSMELNHLRRFGRKYEVRKDVLTPETRRALQLGTDGIVIEVDDLGMENFRPIQDAPLDAQHYQNIRMIETEVRQIIGLDEFIKGASAPSVTATQTVEISKGTTLRVQWRKDVLQDFLIKTFRKLWQVLQQFHDAEDMLPIVGKDGLTQYKPYNRAEILGEYELTIGVESGAPPDRQQEIKNAMDRYNLFRQDPKVDARHLILSVLEAMRVPNPEELVKAPDELEKEIIQRENKMLSQGQAALAHPNDDHQTHLASQGPQAKEFESRLDSMNQQFEELKMKAQRVQDPALQQQAQQMQQQIGQIQKVAQAWQAHVQQHQGYVSTDMGAGEPVNPNIMNRRTGRTADMVAEFQGG